MQRANELKKTTLTTSQFYKPGKPGTTDLALVRFRYVGLKCPSSNTHVLAAWRLQKLQFVTFPL